MAFMGNLVHWVLEGIWLHSGRAKRVEGQAAEEWSSAGDRRDRTHRAQRPYSLYSRVLLGRPTWELELASAQETLSVARPAARQGEERTRRWRLSETFHGHALCFQRWRSWHNGPLEHL